MPKAVKKGKPRPRLTVLAEVHPRVHFCRNASLVKLVNGLDRLSCREYGPKDTDQYSAYQDEYDLYIDGKPLIYTNIDRCDTCACLMRSGYGDGLLKEEDCLAVRDQLNSGFTGLKNTLPVIAPLVGLMKSGLFLVADYDLFPVRRWKERAWVFWDNDSFWEELHFHHGWGEDAWDSPLYLAASQRASLMNPDRVAYYRQRISEGDAFPRAVALYLNGGVALLLDGHHKAMACAMEGVPVKTLVIFPMENQKGLESAVNAGDRLYLQHTKGWKKSSGPMTVRDGQGNVISPVTCLETMPKRRVVPIPEEQEAPEWGIIPEEYHTERFMDYPEEGLLCTGTFLQPNQIRGLLDELKKTPRKEVDSMAVSALRNHTRLFPDSKWITPADLDWLDRIEDEEPWNEFPWPGKLHKYP